MSAADFPGRVRAASIDLARDFPLEDDPAAPLPSVFESHPQPLIRVLDVDERARAVLQGAPLEEIETPAEPPWPAPPDAVAYHGVIGEVALAIAAETELDPAAILASLLTNFGVLVGNGWTLQSGSAQTASLYTALVGDTNDSRKGSTMHASGQVWKRATSGLSEDVLLPGVASGEGLASVLNDRSASGGRALLFEPEFGRLLTVMARRDAILEHMVRDAYDGVIIGRALAKESYRVTNYHLGILGAITPTELAERLTAASQANGFANRFMFICARATRIQSRPPAAWDICEPYVDRLRQAWRHGQSGGVLDWDAEAGPVWDAYYVDSRAATAGPQRLIDAVVARGPTHVVRLAITFALADCARTVGLAHLRAARALWDRVRAR